MVPEKKKSAAAGDEDDDDENVEMNEDTDTEMDANREPTKEEIEAALKYKITKEAEAEKIRSYKQAVE